MRYYSTERPVSLGTYPKSKDNKITEIFNYDDKTYIEEIGREAWGYIDYLYPLSNSDIINYELVAEQNIKSQ